MPELLWTGPPDAPVLVLAHGAGAAMDSEWMTRFCDSLAERGVRTARFEFGYMAARRAGARKPPPKAETLMGEYRDAVGAVVDALGGDGGSGGGSGSGGAARVAIGGKSMGGRVASLVADELSADGTGPVTSLVCLGYPFHPPGAPEKLRTAHLAELRTPTLILQGTRDPFGTVEQVPGYALSPSIRVSWLDDGEHEFKPRVKISGHTHAEHLATAATETADFVRAHRL
ncbi:alpha/beta family hydrolase [Herbiconiux sp. KACC 21604]|uniref:alpha/beta family hydrolase n=1 Tax=unclassified Herbiconiux TaxID=2618217 RepID=UPI00149208F7|nr:alpha/beta family hydrolase [Herbiconiux sp. SALV-R1]QJU55773.1 alpha/beta hydrolase [Herbiconiux sp. SALV-R1]WPO86982.1 alpha/beta family hydrolase [Herbiconiux sp. KACC 21604]